MPRIRIDMPDNYLFSTEIPVRISDINYGGHLGNDAVLSMVHEARIRFLRQYHYTEMDIEGAGLVLSDSAIIYKAEGFYGDCIHVITSYSIHYTKLYDAVAEEPVRPAAAVAEPVAQIPGQPAAARFHHPGQRQPLHPRYRRPDPGDRGAAPHRPDPARVRCL